MKFAFMAPSMVSSDSSMGDGNRLAKKQPHLFFFVQIPLWAMVTLLVQIDSFIILLFRFLYGRW